MNRDLALVIVRSLAVGGPAESSLDALKAFNDRDWRGTFAWLDDSGLALELLALVERTSRNAVLPRWVADDLRIRLANNRSRFYHMKREFDSLNRAIELAGVEFLVLKGFSLVPEYVPDAELRSQYDYDYLVAPRSFETAQRVLEAASLHRKIPDGNEQGTALFAGEALDCSATGEEWYGAQIPRRVELHVKLWEHGRDAVNVQSPHDVLERKRFATWEGLRFPVLADEDALVFQCLHAFHHILDYWCRPSCFLEIARFLNGRSSDDGFWEILRSRTYGVRHVREIAAFVFALASGLFGAPIPRGFALDGSTPCSRALALWVHRYGLDWCLARFPGSKLSLFVHRELVEEPAWSEVLRGRLLPVRRPALVAEAAEPNLKSNLRARWQQWRFGVARAWHHAAGLASYFWNVRGWHRLLSATRPDDPETKLRIPEKPRSRPGMREA